MTTTNSLDIFMDDSNVNIIEFTKAPIETTTIESAFTHDEKADSQNTNRIKEVRSDEICTN